MMKKTTKILVSSTDNFIYDHLIDLLSDVKLVQGGTALASTIRRHPKLKTYLIQKQIDKLDYIETTFFEPDGSLDLESVSDFVNNYSSHSN